MKVSPPSCFVSHTNTCCPPFHLKQHCLCVQQSISESASWLGRPVSHGPAAGVVFIYHFPKTPLYRQLCLHKPVELRVKHYELSYSLYGCLNDYFSQETSLKSFNISKKNPLCFSIIFSHVSTIVRSVGYNVGQSVGATPCSSMKSID